MVILYLLGFIINPFILINFLYFHNVQTDRCLSEYSVKQLLPFVLACIGYVSFVNATKVPDSDLIWYLDSYERAFQSNFLMYLPESGPFGYRGTDIGYAFFTWAVSNITHSNLCIFVFLHSFISFSIFCAGLFNWGKYLNVKVSVFMAAIVIACFFPYIFTRSAHIMRQFSATCFLFYLISMLPFSDDNIISFLKKNWWLLVLMFSFHKSSLFFVVLLCIPFLRRPFSENRMKYLSFIVALVAYQIVASLFLPFLAGSESALATAVERASTGTTFELEGIKIYEYFLIFIIGGIALFEIRKVNDNGFRLSLNILVILMLFILMNVSQLEMARRFFYYLLLFLPLSWLMVANRYKLSSLLSFGVVIFNFVSFALYTEFGFWVYKLPWGVLFTPVFDYEFVNSIW